MNPKISFLVERDRETKDITKLVKQGTDYRELYRIKNENPDKFLSIIRVESGSREHTRLLKVFKDLEKPSS